MRALGAEELLNRTATLDAFRRRETGAVRAVYRDYGRAVYAIAYRVLGRADLAEEAVQQTFLRAWQAADRLDVDRDPTPWLVTIAKHAAIDVLRREARRPSSALDEVATNDPTMIAPPPDLATLDVVWRVRRAIDELPHDEAMVVRLQHLDGMTHAEISRHLGIALGTVKSRSHRAHRHLAARLQHLQTASRDRDERLCMSC